MNANIKLKQKGNPNRTDMYCNVDQISANVFFNHQNYTLVNKSIRKYKT